MGRHGRFAARLAVEERKERYRQARHGREGGLPKLVEDLRKYGAAHPTVSHWKPAEILLEKVAKV